MTKKFHNTEYIKLFFQPTAFQVMSLYNIFVATVHNMLINQRKNY